MELIVSLACVPAALKVMGDVSRIRQVLLNLLSNAVKFTSQGEIVAEVTLLQPGTSQQQVRFEVRDTGIGLTSEGQAKLFQPFTQADSSTTRRFGGTGLGLAICKGLVQAMGGEIGLSSQIDRGASFYFTLPMINSEASEPTLPTSDIKGLRILIVDDNRTNFFVFREQLIRWGCHPQCVLEPAEALPVLLAACAEGKPFDIVLLDFQMPGMTGHDVAAAIRAESRLNHT